MYPTGLNTRRSTWRTKCDWSEAAEEAVLLTVRPGSEVDGIGVTAGASVADPQTPQPVNQDLLPLGIDNRAEELAGTGIESVDATVAEIADQNRAGKWAEARRSLRQAPRRIEMPVLGESGKHVTAEIKSIHDAVGMPGDVVMLRCVLHRVGDVQHAARGYDIERSIAGWQLGIGERRGHEIKRGVIHLDGACAEIRRVQESFTSGGIRGHGKPFVHGTIGRSGVRGIVHRDDAVCPRLVGVKTRRIDARVPADDRPVLGSEEENSRRSGRVVVFVYPGDLESLPSQVQVEDVASRCSIRTQWIEWTGNTDDEWVNADGRVVRARHPIECRHSLVIICHPKGGARRFRDPPRVHKVGIDDGCSMQDAVRVNQVRNVGGEIRYENNGITVSFGPSVGGEVRFEIAATCAGGPAPEKRSADECCNG